MDISSKHQIYSFGQSLQKVGLNITRLGLITVIGWIGAMKFTGYEAHGISGFVSNSPFLSWTYTAFSQQAFSNGLGIIEIIIATAIFLGAKFPKLSVLGGLAAFGMFLTTLSFMLSTPGTFEPSLGGFPALSVVPGQFLIKDLIGLGASVFFLGDGLARATLTNSTEEKESPNHLLLSSTVANQA